jgi:hypothetical protein
MLVHNLPLILIRKFSGFVSTLLGLGIFLAGAAHKP